MRESIARAEEWQRTEHTKVGDSKKEIDRWDGADC